MINVAMVAPSLGSLVSPVSVPRCSGKTAAGKARDSVTSTVTQEGFQVRKRFLRPARIVAAAAAMAECARQQKALVNDISVTAALVGTDHVLVRAAASLGGENVSPV